MGADGRGLNGGGRQRTGCAAVAGPFRASLVTVDDPLRIIQLEGNTTVGRAYISEFGHLRDGSSQLNYSIYHDRYQRAPDGWKFAERVHEVRYLDNTPLAGSSPHAAGHPRRSRPRTRLRRKEDGDHGFT